MVFKMVIYWILYRYRVMLTQHEAIHLTCYLDESREY